MATSERILTTPPSTSGVQSQTLVSSAQPIWLQALLDFATVLITLIAGDFLMRSAISAEPWHLMASHLASASMVSTMLAFAGAYPRHRTPLDIASTEGVVRAGACVAILLAISSIGWHAGVPRSELLLCMSVALLLVTQRELMSGWFGRGRFPWCVDSTTSKATVLYPVADQSSFTENRASFALKRTVDFLVAASLLILALPLGLGVAILIKLDSEGPVFLRQKRIGRCGIPFSMWKFRSMHVGVARYARSPISDSDPRLTRLGRALRRLSIDELPQLLNILKGDMSLVGPRPEMPFIVKDYTAFERLRLNATPGITGLWQISPARAMPIHQNLELDLYYIEHQSFFLDTAIMLRTVTAVVRGIGAL